jgi:hypothetical protein
LGPRAHAILGRALRRREYDVLVPRDGAPRVWHALDEPARALDHRAMRPRLVQIFVGAAFGLMTLAGAFVAAARWDTAGPRALLFPAFTFLMASVAIGVLQIQIRTLAKKSERLRANLETIATQLFDAPAVVRPGYDLSVTAGAAMAAWATSMEAGTGFTADGRVRDVRVSIASHTSTVGRQLGELSHVYSHVVVDVLGLDTPFRLSKEGVGAMIGRATGLSKDVALGDPAFDAAWNVHADEDLARAVLDPLVRARLTELESKVGLVSQNYGVGTMSVILTSHGLALRWPGEIDAPLAQYMRDLLLDMRSRMLAHVDRKAARAGRGEGYRVAADAAPSPDAFASDSADEAQSALRGAKP